MKTCWFAQQMTIKGRVNASIEDEKFFRGNFFKLSEWMFFMI